MSNKQHNLWALTASMLLFFAMWCILFPHYRYILDSDAVGYLTIAKRVPGGWHNSINGLWSPLNSWLISIFYHFNIWDGCNNLNIQLFNAALAFNAFFAGAIIILTYYLLQRFVFNNFYKNTMLLTMPFVLVYFSYMQVFADVLQIDLLLIYLLIVTHQSFFKRWWHYILIAIIIALAHLSKAYSLPFFILHFMAIHLWHYKNTKQFNIAKMAISIILVMLLLLPWALQLQQKYSTFTYMGNAGKLNMSWNLIAGKTFNDSIKLLIPPALHDSPCFWEDPYLSQGSLHTPFENANMFLHWIARIGHTCITAVVCCNEISFLIIPIILLGIFFYFKTNNKLNAIVFAGIIMPLGFLTMHIETRYIWLLTFLIIIIGGVLLQKFETKFLQKLATVIFALSLLIFPFYNMEILYKKGKTNFEIAKLMLAKKIDSQSFTSNSYNSGNMWVMAYLSNNQFYTIEKSNYTQQELEKELLRYGIKYYLHTNENNCLPFTIISSNINYQTVFQTNEYTMYKLEKK
jgi:hypothetical protein